MLKALPDVAPMDPKHMAEVVSAAVDKAPKPESFIPSSVKEEPVKNTESVPDNAAVEVKSDKGFMVTDDTAGEQTEE